MTSRLLKGSEVAEILNVSKAFAYRMMAQGRIPAVRLGRSVRVRPEDLEGFIADSVSQDSGHLFPTEPVRQIQEAEDIYG